jgi:hypothetical protein
MYKEQTFDHEKLQSQQIEHEYEIQNISIQVKLHNNNCK